ncbi:GPI ethanolamine phosphate transferase 3 subunit O [Nematocida sp. AWRm80]|nr:GPI ethanolamine phosphate transferase 3 subunit O [Nematocida sp. AWRm80]
MNSILKGHWNAYITIATSILWALGLGLYARSLFLEKSPIELVNDRKEEAIYKKGVVLVVDGLRADAIYRSRRESLYHNNFTLLDNIPSSDIYRAVSIADLPTGTSMRIMSIFSGVPTTLLSAQRSFSQQKCEADNFIGQLQRNNKSFVFYGDETWVYLFPTITSNLGKAYHPYGLVSFDEEELLMEQALESMKTNDVVIIHLICVDSYGHVYTVNSKEVQKGIILMDGFINRLYSRLENESFVAVLSDHGVNDDGSHGGTSFNERAASLMILAKNINSSHDHTATPKNSSAAKEHHSKNNGDSEDIEESAKDDKETIKEEKNAKDGKGTKNAKSKQKIGKRTDENNDVNSKMQKIKNEEEKYSSLYKKHIKDTAHFEIEEKINIVSQNDILPTLCAFIGIPTPYNSPGQIISDVIPVSKYLDIHITDTLRKQRALNKLLGLPRNHNYVRVSRLTEKNVLADSQKLSEDIHAYFHETSFLGMVSAVILLCFTVLVHMVSNRIRWYSPSIVLSVVAIFMVAHSVYSIIHEDIISIGMIIALIACVLVGIKSDIKMGYVKSILEFLGLSLLVGRFPLHEMDRFKWIAKVPKIPCKISYELLEFIGISNVKIEMVLFIGSVLCVLEGIREYLYAMAVDKLRYTSQRLQLPTNAAALLMCLGKALSNGILSRSRSVVLLLAPRLLPVFLYSPLSALFTIFVFQPVVSKTAGVSMPSEWMGAILFFVSKIMFFSTGHNHNLSTINWEAAFVFSKEAIPVVSGLFVAADILYPAIYITWVLGLEHRRVLGVLVLLQGITAMLCSLINFWFLGQSLMWFIFAGRTVFEYLFLMYFVCAFVFVEMLSRVTRWMFGTPSYDTSHVPVSEMKSISDLLIGSKKKA